MTLLGAARAGRERDWLLLAVAYNHALRASEATELTADMVTEHGITIVGLKDGETVTQPLIEHREPLLNERSSLLAFLRGKAGKQRVFGVGRRRFWELMQAYGERADIPEHKRHPHTLRHTCAMNLVHSAGVEHTRMWLRHRNLGSTGAYLLPSQEQVNTAVLAAMESS